MSIETLAMQAIALVTLALLLGSVVERAVKKPTHGGNREQATRNTQPNAN
jgi:hypothetical protein